MANKVMSEKEFEDFVLSFIHEISEACGWGEIRNVERQYIINNDQGSRSRVDIMIWHKDGTGTCIECKKDGTNTYNSNAAISQLMYYGMLLEANLSEMPRLVLATPTLDQTALRVKKRFNLPISIMQIQEGKCIYIGN